MPHRISPVLTEEDKIYLQNTNNQDIKFSYYSVYCSHQKHLNTKRSTFTSISIAVNSGIFFEKQRKRTQPTRREVRTRYKGRSITNKEEK